MHHDRVARLLFLALLVTFALAMLVSPRPFPSRAAGETATPVTVIPPGSVQKMVNIGTNLFFVFNDGVHGQQVGRTDGTSAGTVVLTTFQAGASLDDFARPLTVIRTHLTHLMKCDNVSQ